MQLHDKVTYNSINGPVSAEVVEVTSRAYGDISSTNRLTLRSTSRTNPAYPPGYEWTVSAGSASVVARP